MDITYVVLAAKGNSVVFGVEYAGQNAKFAFKEFKRINQEEFDIKAKLQIWQEGELVRVFKEDEF